MGENVLKSHTAATRSDSRVGRVPVVASRAASGIHAGCLPSPTRTKNESHAAQRDVIVLVVSCRSAVSPSRQSFYRPGYGGANPQFTQ